MITRSFKHLSIKAFFLVAASFLVTSCIATKKENFR